LGNASVHPPFRPPDKGTLIQFLSLYFSGGGPAAPAWPSGDYDTIWTVTLDAQGNLTVDNRLFEGIDSTRLPAAAPQF
jgi:hypothetical protein